MPSAPVERFVVADHVGMTAEVIHQQGRPRAAEGQHGEADPGRPMKIRPSHSDLCTTIPSGISIGTVPCVSPEGEDHPRPVLFSFPTYGIAQERGL